jgi:hypothetical protein
MLAVTWRIETTRRLAWLIGVGCTAVACSEAPIETRSTAGTGSTRPSSPALASSSVAPPTHCGGTPLPDTFDGPVKGTMALTESISLSDPEAELAKVDAKTIVLKDDVSVIIDYPIAKPWQFPVKAPAGGFTRVSLVREIARLYRCVYDEEARSTKVPVGRAGQLMNRNETDGTFGICCHDLGDLVLDELRLIAGPDGRTYVALGISS